MNGGSDPAPGAAPWWKTAVFYQIYPRSFCDSTGNGVGDLEGIRRRLDHVAWLGVDAIWLSPFYRSPMADFGYDVSDYCAVDPLFGTLENFDALVSDVHDRGLKIIVDWVPNHSSHRHPWFLESKSSHQSSRRDWYWWRDGRSDEEGGYGPPGSPGRLPNNWLQAFPSAESDGFPPSWTWDATSEQWYLHLFLPEQPDLNWESRDLRAAMHGTLRFWMDRGVDGFRLDAIHCVGKNPELPDISPQPDGEAPRAAAFEQPRNHRILSELRKVTDSAPSPERVLVGEVYLRTTQQISKYYGTKDRPELQLSFNFQPLLAGWDAGEWRECIADVERDFYPADAWPTWCLGNHDQHRLRSRYGSAQRARAAAVILLGLRGTPFVYAGDELGLADAAVPHGEHVDPGGRDGQRAPIPWDPSPAHGWAGAGTWLPWPPGADTGEDVETLRNDTSSILNVYKRLITLRSASPAWTLGDQTVLDSPEGILLWRRDAPSDARVMCVNFSPEESVVKLPEGSWRLAVSTREPSSRAQGDVVEMVMPPDTGAVLEPGGPAGATDATMPPKA